VLSLRDRREPSLLNQFKTIAEGLQFPEGPVAMPDGSFLICEMARGTLTRVWDGGRIEPIARITGTPNGAQIGPDGRAYICNNGGLLWTSHRDHGTWTIGHDPAGHGGSIDVVDLATGYCERLYTEHEAGPLLSPNDLVFDAHGGFWFTDVGVMKGRVQYRGGIYYAKADGSGVREVVFPLTTPNGIGLSPDGRRLYVAETLPGRCWAFDIVAPGEIRRAYAPGEIPTPDRSHILAGGGHGRLVVGLPGFQLFDSLGVDAEDNVCIATLVQGSITVVSSDGRRMRQIPLPDTKVTNICWGGPELRTAYVTLSASGRLIALDWPCPGAPLNYLNN
jgi:gluconolactonase